MRGDPRIYLEIGHMQGLRRPVTPMGVSVLREATRRWLQIIGVDDAVVDRFLVAIGGRLFIDLTGFLRSPRLHSGVPEMVQVYGPAVARGVRRVLDDPRYAPRPTPPGRRVFSAGATARLLLAVLPASLLGALRAGELHATLRGMPHNVTTQMDLQLWSVAETARPHRELLVGTAPDELAERFSRVELPEFLWLTPLAEVRRQLLTAGAELTERDLLEQPGDILFLTLDEALDAAHGEDLRAVVTGRRREHHREARRRQVPGLLPSDGTNPQALPDDAAAEHGPDVLVSRPAATGVATGPVRIVHHPSEARLQPGDILVAPTTDPGWTPLFLTLGGLITETGSAVAHGPTVARVYGIPAVICVPDATTRLTEGRMVTIDGATGLIRMLDTQQPPGADDHSGRA